MSCEKQVVVASEKKNCWPPKNIAEKKNGIVQEQQ